VYGRELQANRARGGPRSRSRRQRFPRNPERCEIESQVNRLGPWRKLRRWRDRIELARQAHWNCANFRPPRHSIHANIRLPQDSLNANRLRLPQRFAFLQPLPSRRTAGSRPHLAAGGGDLVRGDVLQQVLRIASSHFDSLLGFFQSFLLGVDRPFSFCKIMRPRRNSCPERGCPTDLRRRRG